MFADIVGYTAMMQHSEAEAVASRDRFREALAESVQRHHGTAIQHHGDDTLAIFSQVVGVFAVADERIVVPTARDIEADAPAERSVAVLPFVNMSGDHT